MKKLYLLIAITIFGIVFLFYPAITADSSELFSEATDINGRVITENYVENEVIVKFKDESMEVDENSVESSFNTFKTNNNLSLQKRISRQNSALLKSDTKTTEELIDELSRDPAVEYVEPNYIYHASWTPNDASFGLQWGFHNTGQTVNGTAGTADADIDMPEAWSFLSDETMSEVKVAVLDSGVALNSPELENIIQPGYDFVDDDAYAYDYLNHGTHVAGTIAATTNNSIGVSGFGNEIKIIPIRVLGITGSGTTADIVEGLYDAYDRGAKIINMSLGGSGYSASMYNAIGIGAADYDCLIVAAAGNDSTNNDGGTHQYPSDYDLDNIISVTATDQNDSLASFSNYGTTSVDVAAPGVNIYSTAPYNVFDEDFNGASVTSFSGTEFSSSGSNNYWKTDISGSNVWAYGDSSSNPYSASSNGIITSTTFDSTGEDTAVLQYTYFVEAEHQALCSNDYLSAQVFNGSTWTETMYYCGSLQSDTAGIDVTSYRDDSMRVRFKWVTDGSDSNYFGAAIDNVKVLLPESEIVNYEYMNGTSMATPHVAGLAAMLKSYNPNYAYTGLKNAIMENVDIKAGLSGYVASGGRINAYKAFTGTDTINPTATINYSSTLPTNSNVVATLVPSETVTVTNNSGSLSYTFLENGSYTFEFQDEAGNPGTAIATVSTIDKVVPTATISYSTTDFTQSNVVATLVPSETITVTNNSGLDTYNFLDNGSFVFSFEDAVGNEGTATATVANIDLVAPTDPTAIIAYSDSSKVIQLDNSNWQNYQQIYFEWSGAEDSVSGIEGYYVRLSKDSYADALDGDLQTGTSFTTPRLTADGVYYLNIKTIDNAGHVSEGTSYYVSVKVPFIITGTKEGGGPEVRVYTSDGYLITHFNAYAETFRGGVNVATGDIDGDGVFEIITAAGIGGGPQIRIFDFQGNNKGWDFFAYDTCFRGGVNVAVGDVDGGKSEIVTAPMSAGGPNTRVFGYRSGVIQPTTENFLSYASTFRGGVSVSVGDLDGGKGEIITTPTSNGGPQIRIFGYRDSVFRPVVLGIMAYAESFRGGINSVTGDVNGDGRDEIVTGIVKNGGPHLRIFGRDSERKISLINPGFMAYHPDFRGGVSLASCDVNDDGYDEIITGVGGDGNPLVRIFDQNGVQVMTEFNAYSTDYQNGITVACAN
ncbi:S8 family serine peptidase [Patescibacteria group bacterium]|nr:S8 family serine peptidase [Patescibacteria group bacterium]